MAQLKSLIDELDIINEKLERMNGLLTTALEKYEALQTRDAELHVHPTTEQKCPNCNGEGSGSTETGGWICGTCKGTGISNRSDVG